MALSLSSHALRASITRACLSRNASLAMMKCSTSALLQNHPSKAHCRFFASSPSGGVSTPTYGSHSTAMRCTNVNTMNNAERAKVDEDLDGVFVLPHFRGGGDAAEWRLPHPVWTPEEMDSVKVQHLQPRGLIDWTAYTAVMALRRTYDFITGYSVLRQNENACLRRIIFLETVAGVPGMVGAAIRHMRSLRTMERDYGWIHTLLEEAENERMHLMTAMVLRDASMLVKLNVMIAQGVFVPLYSVLYAVSPKFCHRFVGYLEEQAVKTYTDIVRHIDEGDLPGFTVEAPAAIRKYWKLPEGSTLKDVFLAMRADEDHHREVNHTFAEVQATATNPFPPGF